MRNTNMRARFCMMCLLFSVGNLACSYDVYAEDAKTSWNALEELLDTGSGQFDENIYTNEKFGFQIILPESMVFMNEDEVQLYNSEVNVSLEQLTQGMDVVWEEGMFYTDMVASNDVSGTNINVSLAYTAEWSALTNQIYYEIQEPFFETMESMHEESGYYDGEVEISIEKTLFLGEEVSSLVTHAEIGGQPVCQRQVTICQEGNRAVITVASESDEKTAAMIAGIEKLAVGSYEVPISERIVREVQEQLNLQGMGSGTPDGIYGNMTKEAIQAYQAYKGMPVDGKISNELLESLGIVGSVIEVYPIGLNNIYYELNDNGTGKITFYFDNLTDAEYKFVKIYMKLYDEQGALLGEENTFSMKVAPKRIIQSSAQIQYEDVHKISIYQYGFKGIDGENEFVYMLDTPVEYTIEEIQSGKAKKNSSLITDVPVRNEGITDLATLDTLLPYLGKNIYDIPGNVWGMKCSLFGYEGYFSPFINFDETLAFVAWNIDGLITEETLNNILDEAEKLYGKYDEEYGIGLVEHCYEWDDINGYAMTFRYSPEDERQFYITWADSSNEQDTIMLYE